MASSVIPRYLQSDVDIQVTRGSLPGNGSGSITISGTAALLLSTSAVDVNYGGLYYIAGSTYQNHGFTITALKDAPSVSVSQSAIGDGSAVITLSNGAYREVNVSILVLAVSAGGSVRYAAN